MAKSDRFLVRKVKQLARWLDIPLAEDESGALRLAKALAPITSVPATPEPGSDAAKAAFDLWKDVDPFPEIAPSLLNAADIDDYMRVMQMVFPYSETRRKTASYALRVGAEVAFWKPKHPANEPPIRRLNEGEAIIIPSNSLIYVSTWERFQLPNYMAVRFNLHIDLVHKGLLLGTGPLVDPGFLGHLMVPLHNLTTNDYVLAVGEEFIWAEFTKTSAAQRWARTGVKRPPRSGELKEFPERKLDQTLADYINKARQANPDLLPGKSYANLQNAIPEAIAEASKRAAKAKASAVKAKSNTTWIRNIGLGAILAALVGVISIYISSNSAITATVGLLKSTNKEVQEQADRIRSLEGTVNQLRASQSSSRQALPPGNPVQPAAPPAVANDSAPGT